MFKSKTPAEAYAAAVEKLSQTEAAHRKNLDRLYTAREARDAARITPLRRDCEKSERTLAEALAAAFASHRAYWNGRLASLDDEMKHAAILLAEFDALAKLAGDHTVRPSLRRLEHLANQGHTAAHLIEQDVLCTEGVPAEPPDSALLEDERGAWR
jgi:hypothetical protein